MDGVSGGQLNDGLGWGYLLAGGDSCSLSLVKMIEYPEIEDNTKPRHRFMSSFEQRVQACDKRYQYLLFHAEPYEIISFKVPSTEIDKSTPKFFSHWDPDLKMFTCVITQMWNTALVFGGNLAAPKILKTLLPLRFANLKCLFIIRGQLQLYFKAKPPESSKPPAAPLPPANGPTAPGVPPRPLPPLQAPPPPPPPPHGAPPPPAPAGNPTRAPPPPLGTSQLPPPPPAANGPPRPIPPPMAGSGGMPSFTPGVRPPMQAFMGQPMQNQVHFPPQPPPPNAGH
ncbi:hypothetical protein KSP39_PZI002716 [Platanthera zijinensis]|uniref:SF3A2 domain-containing protein n=1 Tax=Platanthera zijinensis TaxID=2320716 RepID=A0AAP0BYR5_9ASPA